MKKPESIKIVFPVPEKYFKPAVKKYFKSLDLQILKLDYSTVRCRKVFKYRVVSANSSSWYCPADRSEGNQFDLQLKLIE